MSRARRWCLLKCVYVLFASLLCVLFFPPSVTGMAVLNLPPQQERQQQERDVHQHQLHRLQTTPPHQPAPAPPLGFGANAFLSRQRRRAPKYRRVNGNRNGRPADGAGAGDNAGAQYCHARDPSTRAYLAPAVFEGKVMSMSAQGSRSNYSAVFQVTHVHKNRGGGRLEPSQYLRLQFAHKLGKPQSRCGLRRERAGAAPGGLVAAKLHLQQVYLVFLQRRDAKNYTVLGEPVPANYRDVQAVKRGVGADYGKPANVTELRDASGRLGGRARLVCRVSGQPPPRVTWFRDGTPIRNQHSDQRVRIRHLRRRSVLLFQNLTRGDAGRYECRARGGPGSPAKARAFLSVIVPPEITSTTPREPTATDCPHQFFCLNGGTCMFFRAVAEPACKCAEGFTGQRCENKEVSNRSSRYQQAYQCRLGLSTSYYC